MFIPLGEVQLQHLPGLLPSPNLSLLGKRLAHSFTSWGRGSDLALLVREGAPRKGAVPTLLNALSTHLMLTWCFCTMFTLYRDFSCVPGCLPLSPPTRKGELQSKALGE